MSETRTCHICGTVVGARDACPTCVAAFPNRRKADEMTGDERAAELEDWYGILEIPFDMMHQRIEELVGRPVWTHEMVHREMLTEEARQRTGEKPTLDQLIDRMPSGKPVIVVGG